MPRKRRGQTLPEVVIACLLGALVLGGGLLAFVSGIRLSLGIQAGSKALQDTSTGVDRLRQHLEDGIAAVLPSDSEQSQTWPTSTFGGRGLYQSTDPSAPGRKLDTAVFVSFPGTRSLVFRTSPSQTQTRSLAERSEQARGSLLYRGTSAGQPSASGKCLWQDNYEGGSRISHVLLYKNVSSRWDAVVFRRWSEDGRVLRYRVLLEEKDGRGQERTALGGSKSQEAGTLEMSDFALTLLNYTGKPVDEHAYSATSAPASAAQNNGSESH